MKLKAVKKSESAFTLVEVLAVMVIIGILVSLTIGLHGHVKERQKESVLKTEMAAIELALEEYKSKHSAYPSSEHWGVDYPSENWNLVSFPAANTLHQSLCGENGYLKDIPEKRVGPSGALMSAISDGSGPLMWYYNSYNPRYNKNSYDLWVQYGDYGDDGDPGGGDDVVKVISNWEN